MQNPSKMHSLIDGRSVDLRQSARLVGQACTMNSAAPSQDRLSRDPGALWAGPMPLLEVFGLGGILSHQLILRSRLALSCFKQGFEFQTRVGRAQPESKLRTRELNSSSTLVKIFGRAFDFFSQYSKPRHPTEMVDFLQVHLSIVANCYHFCNKRFAGSPLVANRYH